MDVRIEGLTVIRGGRLVLDVAALTFASGRVTAILGPNGSGKTTLLRVVAALQRPASGRAILGGQPAAPTRWTREAVAIAFQEPVFISGSLRANLDLALRLRRLPRPERSRRIDEAARSCGITHVLDRAADRLSGGEAQRASLARALALRAPVTLLDEPLSGLDGPARRDLLFDLPRLLREFATTTLLVTHERAEALRLADDLVVLVDGRVAAAGAKGEVFRRPPSPAVAAFLGHTVLAAEGGLVAIAPGALRPGSDGLAFSLHVTEVTDLGGDREAAGYIGETRVAVVLGPATAAPGDTVAVAADPASVVRYPATSPVAPTL